MRNPPQAKTTLERVTGTPEVAFYEEETRILGNALNFLLGTNVPVTIWQPIDEPRNRVVVRMAVGVRERSQFRAKYEELLAVTKRVIGPGPIVELKTEPVHRLMLWWVLRRLRTDTADTVETYEKRGRHGETG